MLRDGCPLGDEQHADPLLGENGKRRFEADDPAVGAGCALTEVLDEGCFAVSLGAFGAGACHVRDLLHRHRHADARASDDQLAGGRLYPPLQFTDRVVRPTYDDLPD